MKKVAFLHCRNFFNTGDICSCPFWYFRQFFLGFDRMRFIDISDWEFRSEYRTSGVSEDTLLIVGGGGLIDYCNTWNSRINELVSMAGVSVGWGIGSNRNPNRPQNEEFKITTQVDTSKFSLFSIRDFNQGLRYVPCVSSLHSQFGKCQKIKKREIGVIRHYGSVKGSADIVKLPYEAIDNSYDPCDIIDFIASSGAIITDSYHMMLWSVWLEIPVYRFGGVDVVDSRIDLSKYKFVHYSEEAVKNKEASIYRNEHEGAVQLNLQFFNDMKKLIS
jgi:hypothetical protein